MFKKKRKVFLLVISHTIVALIAVSLTLWLNGYISQASNMNAFKNHFHKESHKVSQKENGIIVMVAIQEEFLEGDEKDETFARKYIVEEYDNPWVCTYKDSGFGYRGFFFQPPTSDKKNPLNQ